MTRIIGGSAGGRRINTPRGVNTRPTSDRVREALFSAVEAWCGSLAGLRVLDLYAGSGAVGLEARSRGAGVVTLVEHDRRTAALISENSRALGFTQRLEVVTGPVASTLARSPFAPYDLVFLDPPYPMPAKDVDQDLVALVANGWLVPGALVVVERGTRGPDLAWPEGIVPDREKKYGETVLWYGRAAPSDKSPADNSPSNSRGLAVRRAVCPGSFDPVTNGHIDIVQRAASLFDEVVVAVGANVSKTRLFTADERIDMLREAVRHLPNVTVDGFSGLLTTFCTEHGIHAIVKGLRAVSDFDYELQMAQMNSSLTDVETVFVPTSPEYSFLASSLVKEVAAFGGDVSGLVPGFVLERLTTRLAEREQ